MCIIGYRLLPLPIRFIFFFFFFFFAFCCLLILPISSLLQAKSCVIMQLFPEAIPLHAGEAGRYPVSAVGEKPDSGQVQHNINEQGLVIEQNPFRTSSLAPLMNEVQVAEYAVKDKGYGVF